MVAVPFAPGVKLTPEGSVLEDDSDSVGVGYPLACTVKDPAVPTEKVLVVAEVIEGLWSTTRVKFVGDEPEEFVAVTVTVKLPPTLGVPERTPAEDRLTPVGSVPDSENVGAG
ncbi:MAG: hypothetical protein M0010_02485 [Actinomycetota bacterium]|nr:hypothetical protein [Actinomycetota bacterium]